MNIVVLDGFTLNPGDLSWKALHDLGECTTYDRTPAELTVRRARDAEIVLTNKTVLDRRAIEQLPKLQYIGVLATGYNVVDVQAAADRGIVVTNIPAYGTKSVAQMVFAHLLNLTQRVAHHARTVRDGRWSEADDFCYWDTPLVELGGLVMGIVGLGRIGRATADLAAAFGMDVIAHDVAQHPQPPDGVEMLDDLDALFARADVVSLHCPLTEDNRNLVDAERLARMKPTAFLINTSRGPLIDESALAAALNRRQLAGAGLDVLAAEPPTAENPLLTARNCFITPHIAWATRSARARLLNTAVENIRKYLQKNPQNIVSP
jgi:glycerate dehydrogenase